MGHEVSRYVEANVLPVLQQQRQKLEPQLSADDRAQLATYRTQLRTLKQQGEALRRSFNPSGAKPEPGFRSELTDAQREQLHQLRSQIRTITTSVGEMAQKYHEALAKLNEEMQPQKAQWATDIRAIAFKNATPEQQQRMAGLSSKLPERGHLHGPGLHHFFRPVSFLLLEPAAVAAGTPERSLSSTSFYPNPVGATSRFDYEVKTAGPVTVDLLDKNGNKLRTILTETEAAQGAHTQQFDLHDLPAGTYFYKVTTKSSSETKRFVKE